MSASSVHDLGACGVPADQASHVVLPFAACESELWRPTLQTLPAQATAHVRALLRDMRVVARDPGELRSLSPPHERLLASHLGLPVRDGLLPWAAWQRARQDSAPTPGAWGLVTLCHWAMGREHATLSDPDALDLSEDESQALLTAMRPFFESDGIHLHTLSPTRWLAAGPALDVPTASLDRVLGRNVDPWLPSAQNARLLRRLQNEMQMLLYTHPVNEVRQQRRQLTVNSLWFSGTGTLPAAPRPCALHMPRDLAQAALAEDWPGYARAWAQIDATALQALRKKQEAGQTVRLSLCGERGSLTLETAPRGLLGRLQQLTRRPAWPALLEDL